MEGGRPVRPVAEAATGESVTGRSLVGSRRVAVLIAEVEVGEDDAHSLAVAGVEAVSTEHARRIAYRRAVAGRRNHAGLVMTGADHVRAAVYSMTTHNELSPRCDSNAVPSICRPSSLKLQTSLFTVVVLFPDTEF